MTSLWRKQTKDIVPADGENFEKADRITWDVIVIGAGMAGLLTAYYLQKSGKKVLVLEADTIASGQTQGTTAKITSQHAMKYDRLIHTIGTEKARRYAKVNQLAINEYERLIRENHIECQFKRRTSYLYTTENESILWKERKAALSLGIDVISSEEDLEEVQKELPFPVRGAIGFPNQAQFSPLEFVKYIASELTILEHCKVTEVDEHLVTTENNAFTAEKIVIATHYPIRNVPGFYFLRQHQSRSYVLALSGCKKIKGMYYGVDKKGLSFRQAGEYLLLGGSAHRVGGNKKGGAYEYLEKKAREYYPDCKVEERWSAQDCMPHDGLPFIGKYSIFTPNLYVATGFQKWGMSLSMAAALILRDELCGIKNPYQSLFTPQRFHLRASALNLAGDIGISAKGLFMGRFKKKRCTHMGCQLVWNPDEKSWDCPCHGSRFDEKGKVLNSPAKTDLPMEMKE